MTLYRQEIPAWPHQTSRSDHQLADEQGADGATIFEQDRVCMVFPSCSTVQYFQISTQSFNYMDKSNSFNLHPRHTLCSYFNLALLLAQHHARSRSNLNQRNHTHFSGPAQERFDQATILPADQSYKDRLYTATPDLNHCGPSSYNDALSDRMRRRRRGPGIDASRHRNHGISRMESGSRPLSPFLYRPLWPAITRSIG
jgi:hypothetical protein